MKIMDLMERRVMPEIWEKCARLYCEIWKEPPWNEDFWEADQVMDDMKRESVKPGAEFLVAQEEDGQIVGFTWGYSVGRKDLQKISGNKRIGLFFPDKQRTFYVDELAVSSTHRKQGIGKALSQSLIQKAQTAGFCWLALRTEEKAMAARNLYQKLGFREQPIRDAKYPGRTYWSLKF